jgi:hypothetical protein
LTLFHLSLILAVAKKRRIDEKMAALDKSTDIRTRLNGLFEKIEEVRGFL